MNLIIRKMREEDLEPLHRLLSDPGVMEYLEPPFTLERTAEFLEKAMSDAPPVRAVEKDGEFIGYVIWHGYEEDTMELGWVLLPEYWGKGYATALTKQLMERTAAQGKKPVIECDPEQPVTKHIAEKLGFVWTETSDGLDVYRTSDR